MNKMDEKKILAELLGVTIKSVYNYEKEDRPIMKFLTLFSIHELEEFLESGKKPGVILSKQELFNKELLNSIERVEAYINTIS